MREESESVYEGRRLADTVEGRPGAVWEGKPGGVERRLQDKREGRMDEDVGSVVSVVSVRDGGEGTVLPGRAGVYYEAEFDAITFDPSMQEVVDGEVVEVVAFGAFVGIGPVDGLLHVSQISNEYLAYDGENQQLASTESNRTLSVGDSVRVRVVTKSIDERNPRDSKIGLTAKQPGLGKHGWLEDDRRANAATTETEGV